MPSTTAPATRPPPARSSRLATTGLLVLCLLPALAGTVRLVELSSGAVITPDNARFFESPAAVPRHVITQGLGTIGRAEHLLLTASGSGKAAAVAAAVEGPLTASCPASVLQLHPHATVVVDEAAAAHLERADYYRYTQHHKLPHQPH